MGPKIEPHYSGTLILVVLISLFSAHTAANSVSAPHISDAYVDPVKVRPGDMMLVTASVEDDYGISSVTADMGGIEIIELEITEGTIYQGVWQKQWLVHDTKVKDYNTLITATNRLGLIATTEVKWSDPEPPVRLSAPTTAPFEDDKLPLKKILPVLFAVMIAFSAACVYHYRKKENLIEAQREEHIRRVTNVLKEVIIEPDELPLGEDVPAIKDLFEDSIQIMERPTSISNLRDAIRKVAKDFTTEGLRSVDEVRNEIQRIAKDMKKAN